MRSLLLVCALLLAGCETDYVPYTGELGARTLSYHGTPQVVLGESSPRQDIARMYARGFGIVGGGVFSAAAPQTIAGTARTVGAETVLLYEGDPRRPNIDTGKVYAVFFAPLERSGAGILTRSATAAAAQAAGMTNAYVVAAVRPESPAAQAGVEPGDILISLNSRPATDPATIRELADIAEGKTIDLVLLRDGSRLARRLTLVRRW
jgi:membrane-associated protease RseP (regulator of RpoE activity)